MQGPGPAIPPQTCRQPNAHAHLPMHAGLASNPRASTHCDQCYDAVYQGTMHAKGPIHAKLRSVAGAGQGPPPAAQWPTWWRTRGNGRTLTAMVGASHPGDAPENSGSLGKYAPFPRDRNQHAKGTRYPIGGTEIRRTTARAQRYNQPCHVKHKHDNYNYRNYRLIANIQTTSTKTSPL